MFKRIIHLILGITPEPTPHLDGERRALNQMARVQHAPNCHYTPIQDRVYIGAPEYYTKRCLIEWEALPEWRRHGVAKDFTNW